MESILTSIKKMLGITEDYECFDMDIIIHINSAFAALTQIGVGPSDGFSINDESAIWDDYSRERIVDLVKPYVYMKVRLAFDPPSSSIVLEAIERSIKEYEFRIQVAIEGKTGEQ